MKKDLPRQLALLDDLLKARIEKAYKETMHTETPVMTIDVRELELSMHKTFETAYTLGRVHGKEIGKIDGEAVGIVKV